MTIDFSGATPAPAPADQTNQQGATVEPAAQPQSPQDPETFLEIGGRKFTKEDVIKKITNADTFIETLKQERAEDRALLAEVQEALKQQVNIQEVLRQVNQQPEPASTPAVDPNAIVSQVLATLQQQQAASQQETNWTEVTSKLASTYGEKVNEKVAAIAAENGLSLEEAAQLGRTKPALFLKLFPEVGAKPAPTTSAFHRSSNPATAKPATAENSGFGQARTTRESVNIYLSRLKQLTGQ